MHNRSVSGSITGLLQKGGLWFAILLAPCASGAARYVCVSNSTPVAPYTNWATAATTIQAAVVVASNGDTVWVSNGVYSTGTVVTPGGTLSNRVAVTNGVLIRSVNGPQVTIIEGSGSNSYNTASAVRCVYMKNGALDGFTLRGGATYGSAQSGAVADYDLYGGGVNRYGAISGTTVTNCIIRDCRATAGAGAYCGTLETCLLSGNTSLNWGGGAYSCVLNNCTLTNNTSLNGGGASSCGLNNCTLSGNAASNSGGGSDSCTLNNCSLSGNSAYYGGGAYAGTLNNCALSGNTAVSDGGGAYGGSLMHCTLKNCTLTGNKAVNGGGAYNSAMDNCTLTDNSATYGGGAYYNTLNNCTLSGNGASTC